VCGCSLTTGLFPARFAGLGPAPELTNTIWLNTPKPLHLADLRGKVVLLEMWTFDCINCRHTIPQLNAWYKTYASQGLVIIGNHYPEFPVEADLNNLKQAVRSLGSNTRLRRITRAPPGMHMKTAIGRPSI